MQTVGEGVEQWLVGKLESAGLDANVYELNSALTAVLETPDALDRLIQGEDVFTGCQVYQ